MRLHCVSHGIPSDTRHPKLGKTLDALSVAPTGRNSSHECRGIHDMHDKGVEDKKKEHMLMGSGSHFMRLRGWTKGAFFLICDVLGEVDGKKKMYSPLKANWTVVGGYYRCTVPGSIVSAVKWSEIIFEDF